METVSETLDWVGRKLLLCVVGLFRFGGKLFECVENKLFNFGLFSHKLKYDLKIFVKEIIKD